MKIKIVKTERELLKFSDGSYIRSDWAGECCEYNYADFTAIDDLAKDCEFEHPLTFEASKYGFRFGNPPDRMVFVPCYSEQNGYYTYDIDIYYNGECVLKDLECEDHEERW